MENKLDAFILDDEIDAILLLKSLLKKENRINIVGHSLDPTKALQEIKKQEPDILFLDISMPVLSGVDVLKLSRSLNFHLDVVLVTAHQGSAIETVKYNPFDILLKPVSIDQLSDLTDRLFENRKKTLTEKSSLFEDKLIIQNKGEVTLVEQSEIISLNAEGNYTQIVTKELKEYTVSKQLGFVQEKISNIYFYRINRSQVVNVKYLHEIDFKKKSLMLKWNGKTRDFQVSRRHLKELKDLLTNQQ
jgi:two-component system LytT family response regulator